VESETGRCEVSARKKAQPPRPPVTLGGWKTRDGSRALVAASNPDAAAPAYWVGWKQSPRDGSWCPCSWHKCGAFARTTQSDDDLIRPWVDKPKPPEWDWSKTSPWHNWLVLGRSGERWWLYAEKPTWSERDQCWACMTQPHRVPDEFAPKWKGHPKDSFVERPAK